MNTGYLLLLTSVFAALPAFHAAVARYRFSLGREGVPPAVCAAPTRRPAGAAGRLDHHSVPALVVLSAYAVGGAEPLVYVLAWRPTIGGLGLLILMGPRRRR